MKELTKRIVRIIADGYETIANPSRSDTIYPALLGWSIVVITDGKNHPLLNKLMESAKSELKNSPYEIIVVGPPKLDLAEIDKNIPFIHIPYRELQLPKVTGWITKKKNFGIRAAHYDKVVVCHDYIAFKTGWKKGFDACGDFEAGSNIIIDMDGERSTDWIAWDYPSVGQALVPYNKYTEYQYLCGIYFFGKRDFLLKNPLPENLRWGEAEDIEWSKEIRKKTRFIMNTKSTIYFLKPKWKLSQEVLEGSKKLESLL